MSSTMGCAYIDKVLTKLQALLHRSAHTLHHNMQGYDFSELQGAQKTKPAKKGQFFQSTSQVSCRLLCLVC